MMGKSDIRALVAGTWREAGLKGRGGRWRHPGAEVQWVVEIRGDWLGRLSLVADASVLPAAEQDGWSADDRPLRIFAENIPALDGSSLLEPLHPDSNMDEGLRRRVLGESARELADFVLTHDTLGTLRQAYRAGELDSHAIHKGLRQKLEES